VARTNRTGSGSSGGELAALELVRSVLPEAPPGEVWIGDDAAFVAPSPGGLLLTVDTVVEGVHADLTLVGLDDLGWRAVSTAISDVAAMGGRPDRLLVSVAAPPETDLRVLYAGIVAAAHRHGASVVGGDLSTAPLVSVAVAVTGHIPGGGPPVLRSGARAGDSILVTGPLGGAAAGLRALRAATPSSLVDAHRRPVARLDEGTVARTSGATAMIDLSDGIASDLRRIAQASNVGVSLECVPVADGATEHDALCGGDDYELLFTARDPGPVRDAFSAAGLRVPEVLGECTSEPARILYGDSILPDCGYEHPWEIPT
jgi:thiamine-monophosphate kinase